MCSVQLLKLRLGNMISNLNDDVAAKGFLIHMLSGNMAHLEGFLDYHENLKMFIKYLKLFTDDCRLCGYLYFINTQCPSVIDPGNCWGWHVFNNKK
jgi:hypothetical protein